MYRVAAKRIPTRLPAVAQRRANSNMSSGSPKQTAATAGGNTMLLVGGVTALAGIGYWLSVRKPSVREPSMQDVKKEARDFKDVSAAKGEAAVQDAKARAEQEASKARGSVDNVIDRTKSAAHDVKAAADRRMTDARNAVAGTAEDAKREAEREAQKAKEKTSSWFSWGSNKVQEGKEDAAKGVAREAESVRVAADKRA